MTTKQIDYCIELARTLNFSRAADNLFVSQPTFSYQIKLLEQEIGFPVFERSGRGAALTPAGAQFVAFLAGMREDLKRAIEQGQNFSAKYRDSISISLMVRQAITFLPEAMRLFAETHPQVQIAPVFQYENGVGLLRSLSDELDDALELAQAPAGRRRVSVATGTLAGDFHKELAKRIMKRFDNVEVLVYPIVNHFFGETITVAGLVTGGDMTRQLAGKDLGDELIIPKVMLKADEDIFLDDMTLIEAEKALDIKITPSRNDGFEYLDAILGVNAFD